MHKHQIAPISDDAAFQGSLIRTALQSEPGRRPLYQYNDALSE